MDSADCTRTFDRLGDAMAAPGGFEWRALAALVHLREAWCSADRTNRPACAAAMALVSDRCEHKGLVRRVLAETLDEDTFAKLVADVNKYAVRGVL